MKIAIYTRVSTNHQIDKDSLPTQRRELISYSDLILHCSDYEVFEDAGFSAKNTSRPAYQQMMSKIRDGHFTHLLVWKLDRISRNLLDFAEMYSELKKLGVTFISMNEQFDTSTAMGEAMLKIILVFAELERQITSERVSAIMNSRASEGIWNGSRVPYGYHYIDGEFVIDPSEAEIVKSFFDLYEKGSSLLTITRLLDANGIKTRNGNPFSTVTINNILKNPWYSGTYRYVPKSSSDPIIYKDHHPAIVSEERQNHIIKLLTDNQKANFRTYKHTHLFSGLLECAICHRTMIASTNTRDNNPSSYGCAGRRRSGDCTNKYTSDLMIAPFLFNYISNILRAQQNSGKTTTLDTFKKKLLRGLSATDVSGIEPMLEKIKNPQPPINYEPNILSQPLQDIDAERNKILRAIERLKKLYLYSDTIITEQEYITEMRSLTDKLESLTPKKTFSQTQYEKASYVLMASYLLKGSSVNFSSLLTYADTNTIRIFIRSIISKVVILDSKITEIRFVNGDIHSFTYPDQN